MVCRMSHCCLQQYNNVNIIGGVGGSEETALNKFLTQSDVHIMLKVSSVDPASCVQPQQFLCKLLPTDKTRHLKHTQQLGEAFVFKATRKPQEVLCSCVLSFGSAWLGFDSWLECDIFPHPLIPFFAVAKKVCSSQLKVHRNLIGQMSCDQH